ncbi:thiopeptide-type bacteriocin biosynthesis domain-containing protein [Streptomyces sp. TLI_053]|uniref:thiopeptide-type bacteriocin biosynthesis protein n=1 Tax=Streptomyces sp. TLI_053 TaxID=1855352 RepID=UPI00087B9C41|nr:thiopeptide-type bacteriocin biosynthesis protein [Streptomyces sp. TLI_053]SDS78822.1 thiopeptide-type bacteriocin biosynthesis domain-containing protein [Streptomyces sp. TLI_053]
MTNRLPPAAPWQSLHLALPLPARETDAFVTEDLAPLMDRPADSDWFFIRYGEGGPHLRIRFRGTAARADGLAKELARLASLRSPADGPWAARHGEVTAVPYEPETERYGGPSLLPVAEELFTRSTRTAVLALRTLGPAPAARLPLALDLAHTTTRALGLDELAAARWLRNHSASWRWVTEFRPLPGAAVHSRVNTVFAQQRQTLARRAAALREALGTGTAAPWLGDWSAHVMAAAARMRAVAPQDSEQRLLRVWASQLHMLFNRLGVGPDEERAVCRLAGRTLLETDPPFGFFPEGPDAPDRQYLERSKFQIGRPEDTALREAAPPDVPRPAPGDLPLPADPLPAVPLADALLTRRSTRGRLTGPLTAGQLGGLLWSACAPNRPTGDRPYPSAGGMRAVRVRLIALAVEGLPAGTYHCLPELRCLRPIGPAPDPEQLKALSYYLSRPASDPQALVVDEAPAVLAVHLDLAALRQRYGLRALRLGLVETGHLTQNLLLTSAAFGLGTTPLGGLFDDLAHELLALDDLDQPIQYLLPLGRPAAGEGSGNRATARERRPSG